MTSTRKLAEPTDIQPDPQNANQGTDRGREMLAHSLRQYGAGRSILTDRNGVVIAGNKTLETAVGLGLPVRIVETTGDELVVVQRTDLDLTTDKAARELAYADNRVAQIDLEWDTERLAQDLEAGVDLGAFWQQEELAALIDGLPALNTDGLDRVAPDAETARPGLYLHLGDYKIPVSQEEYDRFTDRLDAYREGVGTFYGFVGQLLGSA